MYLVYSLMLALALVVTLPYWVVQALRHGKYRAGLAERAGRVPARLRDGSGRPSIWVHAVSVGEVLAVAGVIRQLRERFPDHRVVVSTTTATGQKLARERFGAENVFYFPLDFAFAVRPYLRLLRPALVVVAETEFWPNFLRLAAVSGARIAVVNARISDRSFRRYRRLRGCIRRVLRPIALFLAQTEEDARRLRAIGAATERVHVSGNLKFDIAIPEAPFTAQLRAMLARAGNPRVVVAGSTLEGEEVMVVEAFRQAFPEGTAAVLVLAPRHPERFSAVAELLGRGPLPVWRRSALRGDETPGRGVLLLDSLGELASVYALADVAFVGGSLVPRGGHNILEPAFFGKTTIVGPHTENFRDIVELFRRERAVLVARDQHELARSLRQAVEDAATADVGRHAAAVVAANAGATRRTCEAVARLVELAR